MKSRSHSGVTIVELTIVILIMSILASIGVTVYSGHVERARFAVARSDIQQIEFAATRYQVDLGEYPLSSSGNPTAFGTNDYDPVLSSTGTTAGSGYLMLCLLRSFSGNADALASPRWMGPYLDVQTDQLGDVNGDPVTASLGLPEINLLDPWGRPYYYVRSSEYADFNATHPPDDSPFLEEFYNPSTFQVFTLGPDGLPDPPASNEGGLGIDDINNFDNRTDLTP
ncbi:prepilin-type N-terminal cleavage/methylation domain-containing protein [bacterium]|nr:prepilin-type N-terminal cleavage/methylation domain-containing protein [bacterium]